MVVLMHFLLMAWVVVVVGTVVPAVLMIMSMRAGRMSVLVHVLVEMFMRVRVRMFVAVLLLSMKVFMAVPVAMLMTVQVTMFVFSFHACSPFVRSQPRLNISKLI